jgi:hypothetical protein
MLNARTLTPFARLRASGGHGDAWGAGESENGSREREEEEEGEEEEEEGDLREENWELCCHLRASRAYVYWWYGRKMALPNCETAHLSHLIRQITHLVWVGVACYLVNSFDENI